MKIDEVALKLACRLRRSNVLLQNNYLYNVPSNLNVALSLKSIKYSSDYGLEQSLPTVKCLSKSCLKTCSFSRVNVTHVCSS